MARVYAQSAVVANTQTTVLTTTAESQLTIRILNRSDRQMRVSLAVSTTTSPTTAEYLEYQATVEPHSVLSNSDVIINTAKNILVTSTRDCTVMIYGVTLP